jgi:hypothetical protein
MIPGDNSKRVDNLDDVSVPFIDACFRLVLKDILDYANKFGCRQVARQSLIGLKKGDKLIDPYVISRYLLVLQIHHLLISLYFYNRALFC